MTQPNKTEKTGLRSDCPINYFVEIAGDKWSLIILRDIVFWGKVSPSQFRASSEQIATNILSSRLTKLINNNIINKTTDSNDRRRENYSLTEKGLALTPILLDIANWSDTFGPDNLSISKNLINDFRNDRSKTLSDITLMLHEGKSVFSNSRWRPTSRKESR